MHFTSPLRGSSSEYCSQRLVWKNQNDVASWLWNFFLKIRLFISTEYTNVTHGQTDTTRWRSRAYAYCAAIKLERSCMVGTCCWCRLGWHGDRHVTQASSRLYVVVELARSCYDISTTMATVASPSSLPLCATVFSDTSPSARATISSVRLRTPPYGSIPRCFVVSLFHCFSSRRNVWTKE